MSSKSREKKKSSSKTKAKRRPSSQISPDPSPSPDPLAQAAEVAAASSSQSTSAAAKLADKRNSSSKLVLARKRSGSKQGLFRRSVSLTRGLFGGDHKLEVFAEALETPQSDASNSTTNSSALTPTPTSTSTPEISPPSSSSSSSSSFSSSSPLTPAVEETSAIEILRKELEGERTSHQATREALLKVQKECKALDVSYRSSMAEITSLREQLVELDSLRQQVASQLPYADDQQIPEETQVEEAVHDGEETSMAAGSSLPPPPPTRAREVTSSTSPTAEDPTSSSPPPPPTRSIPALCTLTLPSSGTHSETRLDHTPRVTRHSAAVPSLTQKHLSGSRPLPPGRGGSVDISLTNIDRAGRKLTEVDPAILEHPDALKISLSCNLLATLPPGFAVFHQLEILDLSYNRLELLPEPVCHLYSLSHLDLSGNRLNRADSFPPEFSSLAGLSHLHLTRNRMAALPASVSSLPNLQVLVLHANCLESFDVQPGDFPSLTSLDLSRNSLPTLPATLGSLGFLTELNLSENCLLELPESIGELCNLKVLDLAQNSIFALPTSIGLLAELESLDLSRNSLEGLPYDVSYLNRLSILKLSHNRIQSLSELDLASMESLRTLSCSSNYLSEVPTSLFHLPSMWRLELAANRIEQVPADLGYLTSLRYLNLAFNRISHVPADLSYMAELRELNLSYNDIDELPADLLFSMQHLSCLSVAGNHRLPALPASVWGAPSLSCLYASSLLLSELPASLPSSLPDGDDSLPVLPSLCRLDVSDNAIPAIPACFAELEFLERLAIAHNKLSGPVPDFSYLYDLKELDLSHNLLSSSDLSQDACERLAEKFVHISLEGNAAIVDPSPLMSRPLYRLPSRFPVGYAEMIGRRPTMEDAFSFVSNYGGHPDDVFIGLYDGHSRADAALFAAKVHPEVLLELLNLDSSPSSSSDSLTSSSTSSPTSSSTSSSIDAQKVSEAIRNSFQLLNERLGALVQKDPSIRHCGSTGVLCYVAGDTCHFANVGDSRAVLCRAGNAIRLTYDHKPADDEDRIRELGGNVVSHRSSSSGAVIDRVNGQLAVSRSIGDLYMHPWVTVEPYVGSIVLGDQDQFLIIGCDGVWDEVSDQAAVDLVHESLAIKQDPYFCSARLRDYAYSLGSDDNISVIVLLLQP